MMINTNTPCNTKKMLSLVVTIASLILISLDSAVAAQDKKNVTTQPLSPRIEVSDRAMDAFRQAHGVKASWVPRTLQKVVEAHHHHHHHGSLLPLSFVIDGVTISFDDLVPQDNLFSANATMIVVGDDINNKNGSNSTTTTTTPLKPTVHVHQSQKHPHVRVVVLQQDDDNMDEQKQPQLFFKALSLRSDGNIVHLVHIENGIFTEIDEKHDLKDDNNADDETGGIEPPDWDDRHRHLNLHHYHLSGKRNLGTVITPDCSTLAVAEVYVAADSDFVAEAYTSCDLCGSAAINGGARVAAEAAIQLVFSAVQDLYRKELCIDLRLKGYQIVTSQSNDPYRNLRRSVLARPGGQICGGSNDVLNALTNYLQKDNGKNDPSNSDRTLFHLFYGAGTSTQRGCAWYRSACSPNWAYGLSEVGWGGDYSNSLTMKRNLLAHELGHNFNAPHDNIGIMKSDITQGDDFFSTTSKNKIRDCLNGKDQCNNSCMDFIPQDQQGPSVSIPSANANTNSNNSNTKKKNMMMMRNKNMMMMMKKNMRMMMMRNKDNGALPNIFGYYN